MTRHRRMTIIALLFIISGATGLIYQIVWFKYLSLFLGNTTYAQTVVLATFMGGLAVGAWLWGRWADRARNPLATYALLEIGIGIYCFAYPRLIGFVRDAFIGIVRSSELPSDGTAVLALKFAVSLSTLLIPTILMGGTLPILVKSFSERLEESGRNVAILYFLNSLGAVCGSALGGFFFVPMIGLGSSMTIAAIVNLLLGMGVLALSRVTLAPAPAGGEYEEEHPHTFTETQMTVALIAAGLSGAASMIFEIGWVRLLIPVVGSSTYSFSLMLIAFISGITIGSWIASWIITRAKHLFALLAVCQFGVVVSLALTLPLYGRIPYAFWHLSALLDRTDATYPVFLTMEFALCLALMIVPTIFLGMNLPIASRIATRSVAVLGRSVGNVFSINTFGTVLGSLLGGLVLIPLLGVKHTIELGLALNAGLVLLIRFHDAETGASRRNVWAGATLGVLALYFLVSPGWSQSVSLSGVFRLLSGTAPPPADYQTFLEQYGTKNILFYKEGSSATVAVIENGTGSARQNILIVNGKPDASSKGDLPSQILIGQLPMLLHPHPQDAFVVGLGSGVTLGSVLTHDVRSVDCAEISPEVVEASAFFDEYNNRPLSDPRVTLRIDDALSFLKLTGRSYDVIVSEPTNPWIAGVGNLYTTEFLSLARERLRPGGLMVQWFHLYEMDDEILRLALRTFRNVFPHITIWQSLKTDIVMVGSLEPLTLDVESMRQKMDRPAVRRDLERIYLGHLASILSLQFCTPARVREYVGTGPLNTEDRPLLEYGAPRSFFLNRGTGVFYTADERMTYEPSDLLLAGYSASHGLSGQDLRAVARLQAMPGHGNYAFAYSLARRNFRENPRDSAGLHLIADVTERMGKQDEALEYRKAIAVREPNNPAALARYAWMLFTHGRPYASRFAREEWEETESLLRKAITLSDDTVDTYRSRLGNYYYEVQRYPEAVESYRRALEIRQERQGDPALSQDGLLLNLARALDRLGEPAQAIAYAAQAALLNPGNAQALEMVARLRADAGRK